MEQIIVEPFNDLGINFKEINHSDFDGFVFEDKDKTFVEPNKDGYISDKLNELIDLNKKDTTVINACVGQGKTTAIIQFIKKYYNQKDCLIIVAIPYKALVKQYKNTIEEESKLTDICFDYQELEGLGINEKNFKDFQQKPIQLISINSLLGNAGQVALKQSDIKRKYYESLIEYSEKNNKKVILIFDEIHEAIHNFKEELIFNLFKWNSVIHKVIVSSATFNEASKVVIKYLAELTEKRIKIYESKRVQFEERLSDLHLCLYDQYNYKANSPVFERLFLDNSISFDKIHILSFSKKLAEDIYSSDLGNKIKEKFGNLNLCTSSSTNGFDKAKNNIGTVFKTGNSIEDDNCAFFIILPPKSSYVKGKLDIFSQGIFTITQALARPRKKANIFIITPNPDKLIMTPVLAKNYISSVNLNYLPFEKPDYQEKFYDINSQDILLKNFYTELKDNLKGGDDFVENSDLGIVPKFPEYDKYKLVKGEEYFKGYYHVFGKNLSNYIYWAAWNNQFVNCKLKSIIKTSTLKFSEGNVQNMLDFYYKKTFSDNSFFVLNSDKDCYIKFRSSLFSNTVKYKAKKDVIYSNIVPFRNSGFEKQIITFIQRFKREFNFEFKKQIYPPDGNNLIIKNGASFGKKKPSDVEIELITYLRLAMMYSVDFDNASNNLSKEEMLIINAYKSLYKYREILLSEYIVNSIKGIAHLPIDKDVQFKIEHQIELNSLIEILKKNDENLKVFSFLQKMKDLIPVFKLLKDVFFETSVTSIVNTSGLKVKAQKLKHIDFSSKSDFINLVYSIDDAWILQSGYGEVLEEYSNDPNYGIFE